MMDAIPETDAAQGPVSPDRKLRLSQWLWKRWYAKLWWAGATVYWIGFALSFGIVPFVRFYESTFAGYLNVVFYPPVILMLLGTGFVRAKVRRGDWIITADDSELHKVNHSMGGSLNPYSNPLDPRSGSLWVGSQESISRVFGKKWP